MWAETRGVREEEGMDAGIAFEGLIVRRMKDVDDPGNIENGSK